MIDDFVAEPTAPGGRVYGLCGALFVAPAYAQVVEERPTDAPDAAEGA